MRAQAIPYMSCPAICPLQHARVRGSQVPPDWHHSGSCRTAVGVSIRGAHWQTAVKRHPRPSRQTFDGRLTDRRRTRIRQVLDTLVATGAGQQGGETRYFVPR